MKNDLIFLIGFMTAGKSTIGKILANTIGWNFFDLDEEIEKLEKKSVTQIFKENGEAYFRIVERDTLQKLSKEKFSVISLGGGTIEEPENLNLITEAGITIYLEISTHEAFKRLKYKRNRPILYNDANEEVSDEELFNRINNILNRRLELYGKAHLKINTTGVKIGRTVDNIVYILQKEFRIV